MGNTDPNYYDNTTGAQVDLDVLRERYDRHLDDLLPAVEAGGARLAHSAFLRAADRGAYDQGFNDWADAMVREGRLSVGPPEREYQITLQFSDMTGTSPVEAVRKLAALLAGSGADGWAWRAVYDVEVDGDSIPEHLHGIDLELVGSGRTCSRDRSHVDDVEGYDEREVTDEGVCTHVLPDGRECGGLMEWRP